MGKFVVIGVLLLLIVATVYDFIKSSKRNKEKFGTDFFLDTVKHGSSKKKHYSEAEIEHDDGRRSGFNITVMPKTEECKERKIAVCDYGKDFCGNKRK